MINDYLGIGILESDYVIWNNLSVTSFPALISEINKMQHHCTIQGEAQITVNIPVQEKLTSASLWMDFI